MRDAAALVRKVTLRVAVALILAAAGCSSGSTAGSSPATTAFPPNSTRPSATKVACPNIEGGVCVGALEASTIYKTKSSDLPLTYQVPEPGWSND